jgi:hypothetical protein
MLSEALAGNGMSPDRFFLLRRTARTTQGIPEPPKQQMKKKGKRCFA